MDDRLLAPLGIVGAGTMGVEIAAAHLLHGVPVRLADSNPSALAHATERVGAELEDREHIEALTLASRLDELGDCSLVIESIVESREAKRPLLKQLDSLLPATSILASNTSTIRLSDLDTELPHPERFCGLHFCHPVRRRAVVELAGTSRTAQTTLDTAAAHIAALGKLSIRTADAPGFVVNRMLFPALSAALTMVLEGVDPAEIDHVARSVGFEKGPLELLDEIGLDVALRCGWELSAAMPDRVEASPLLVGLVKRKQLGTKTGAGIYAYPDAEPSARPWAGSGGADNRAADSALPYPTNPVLRDLIDRWRPSPQRTSVPHSTVADCLLTPMREEADHLLAEGVVSNRAEIDQAMTHGLGIRPAEHY